MLMNSLIKDPALQRKVTPPLMVALNVGIFAALYPRAHDVAWGALAGGGAVTIATVVAMLRKGPSDSSFVRGATGHADERDLRILYGAGTWVGLASVVFVALGMVAAVWGMNALAILGVMAWLQVITFVVAHTVLSRRS